MSIKRPVIVTARPPRRPPSGKPPKKPTAEAGAVPSRIVTCVKRDRRSIKRREATDDEEVSESVKAFFARMVRPQD